ncbi:MAG: hypothetical protein PHV74_15690 [Dehalococcoidia bacterium]|nr:hypothetical protein [Dehalococcoidia bacterium]
MNIIRVGIGDCLYTGDPGSDHWEVTLREVLPEEFPKISGAIDLSELPHVDNTVRWDFVSGLDNGFGVTVGRLVSPKSGQQLSSRSTPVIFVRSNQRTQWQESHPPIKPSTFLGIPCSDPVQNFTSMVLSNPSSILLSYEEPNWPEGKALLSISEMGHFLNRTLLGFQVG